MVRVVRYDLDIIFNTHDALLVDSTSSALCVAQGRHRASNRLRMKEESVHPPSRRSLKLCVEAIDHHNTTTEHLDERVESCAYEPLACAFKRRSS